MEQVFKCIIKYLVALLNEGGFGRKLARAVKEVTQFLLKRISAMPRIAFMVFSNVKVRFRVKQWRGESVCDWFSYIYLQEDLVLCIRYFDNRDQHMSVAPEIEEDFIERFEQASPEYIVTTEDYDSSSEKFDVILRSEYESIWTKDGFCIMKKTDESFFQNRSSVYVFLLCRSRAQIIQA